MNKQLRPTHCFVLGLMTLHLAACSSENENARNLPSNASSPFVGEEKDVPILKKEDARTIETKSKLLSSIIHSQLSPEGQASVIRVIAAELLGGGESNLLKLDLKPAFFEAAKYIPAPSAKENASMQVKMSIENARQSNASPSLNSFTLIEEIQKAQDMVLNDGVEKANQYLDEILLVWGQPLTSAAIQKSADVFGHFNALKDKILSSQPQLDIPDLSKPIWVIAESLPTTTELGRIGKQIFMTPPEDLDPDQVADQLKNAALNDLKNISKVKTIAKEIDRDLGIINSIPNHFNGVEKVVENVSKVSHAVVQIAKLTQNFDFSHFGANLATGNLVCAVSDVLGGLFSMGTQSDPAVMTMLSGIQGSIDDLRKHIDQRMDVMDQKLDKILGKLDEQLSALKRAQQSLDQIQASVDQLSRQMSNLSLEVDQGFDTLIESDIALTYSAAFHPSIEIENNSQMDATAKRSIAEWANSFYVHAKLTSTENLRTGLPVATLSDVELLAAMKSRGALVKTGLLVGVLNSLGLHHHLVKMNLSDFILGSESYLLLLEKYSAAFSHRSDVAKNLGDLIELGEAARDSLKDIGDINYLESLLNQYHAKVDKLISKVSAPDKLKHVNGLIISTRDDKTTLADLKTMHSLILSLMKLTDPVLYFDHSKYEPYFSEVDQGKALARLETLNSSENPDIDSVRASFIVENNQLKAYLSDRLSVIQATSTSLTYLDSTLKRLKWVHSIYQ